MKSKEALERLSKYNNHYVKDKEYLLIDVESEEWKAILKDLEQKEKQDKVLEILKRTKIDLWDFVEDIVYFDEELYGRTAYEWYSMHYREFSVEKLSQEEFDLIVRWLRNDK